MSAMASYQKQLAHGLEGHQPIHSAEPNAKAQAQAALGGTPKLHHYRRSRKHKSPRKRTFVMFMEKIPDGMLGGLAAQTGCGDGASLGGAGANSTMHLQASPRRQKMDEERTTSNSTIASDACASISRTASAASACDPLLVSAVLSSAAAELAASSAFHTPASSAGQLDWDLPDVLVSSTLPASYDKYGSGASLIHTIRTTGSASPAVSECNSNVDTAGPAPSTAMSSPARLVNSGRSAFAPSAFWSLSDVEDITSASSVPTEVGATPRVSVMKTSAATLPVSAFAAMSTWGPACSDCPSGCSGDSATCTSFVSFSSVDWFGGASAGLAAKAVSPATPNGKPKAAVPAIAEFGLSPRTSSSGGADVAGNGQRSMHNVTGHNAAPGASLASSFLDPASQAEAAGHDVLMEDSGAISPSVGHTADESPSRTSSIGGGSTRSSAFSIRLAPRFGAAPGTVAPAGRVRCMQMVSAGAYGNVWRGRWRGRDAAVKLPNVAVAGQELTEVEIRASFVNEMEVLSRVSHAHVAPAMHMQLEGGPVCIVQEYAAWGTLSDYIAGHAGRDWAALEALVLARAAQRTASTVEHLVASPIAVAAARAAAMPVERYLVLLMLLRDVAEGMQYLESVRVVHRDLKPENILISDTGAALLSDFGLSVILPPVTAEGTGISSSAVASAAEGHGTVQYAAPEDLWPGNYSLCPASDAFSFGYCLWEALTGAPPWVGIQSASIIYAVGAQHMRLAVPPTWPAPLRQLIDSTWVKDPASRPNSTQVLAVVEEQLLLAAVGTGLA